MEFGLSLSRVPERWATKSLLLDLSMPKATVRPLIWLLVGALYALVQGCTGGPGARCTPGRTEKCTLSLEGGYAQSGSRSCNADRTWSECIGAGSCRNVRGEALVTYTRCASDNDCGPSSCASCTAYTGVKNPAGFRICHPYCTSNTDCKSEFANPAIAPRCVLGQCVLLCRAGASCPGDLQCLSWLDPSTGDSYPGYDGLCN